MSKALRSLLVICSLFLCSFYKVYSIHQLILASSPIDAEHFAGVPQRRSLLVHNQNTTGASSELSVIPKNSTTYNSSVLFLHVGKAGGETIKNVLAVGCRSRGNKRRREQCFAQLPNATLSTTVSAYYHCFSLRPKRLPQPPTVVLYNLRHPVDRLLSWFRYVHPNACTPSERRKRQLNPNCLAQRATEQQPDGWMARFFACFPTARDWAFANATCQPLAQEAFQAHKYLNPKDDPQAAHLMANLQHYVSQGARLAAPDALVWVVRTHNLWGDLEDLNVRILGDQPKAFGSWYGSAVTHGSTQTKHDADARQALCHGLYNEMQLYRKLILEAVNIPDKQEELIRAMEACGYSSWDEYSQAVAQR